MTKTIAQLFIDNPITTPSDASLFEISEGGTSGAIANINIGPLRKVGTALIGPDFTGNARGTRAIDLQTYRGQAAQVASGNHAMAIGERNTVSGGYGIAIGYKNSVTGYIGTALGHNNTVSGTYASAFGYQCSVLGNLSFGLGYKATVASGAYKATALGYQSYVGVNSCVGLGGPVIIAGRSVTLGIAEIQKLSGAVIVITTAKRNLKNTFDETVTFPSTPAQAYFYVNQVGVWATNVTAMTVQPTVRFGIVGTLAKYFAAAITTHLTAANIRELYSPIVNNDGEVNVTAGVTIGASATTFSGRFFWIGMLVQTDASSAQ